MHNGISSINIELHVLSVIADKTVSLILNVGYLRVNKTANAFLDKRLQLVGVELEECVLKVLSVLENAVSVVVRAEKMSLRSI